MRVSSSSRPQELQVSGEVGAAAATADGRGEEIGTTCDVRIAVICTVILYYRVMEALLTGFIGGREIWNTFPLRENIPFREMRIHTKCIFSS